LNYAKPSTAAIFSAMLAVSINAQGAQNLAQISSEQSAKISTALRIKSPDQELNNAVAEAAPTIAAFLKVNSCLRGYNGSSLNVFAAPGKTYDNSNYIGSPLPLMPHHSKSSCASVARVHGWSMPTKNSIRFEVLYVAEDSGETTKGRYDIQKQPTGEWLFTR